MQPELNSWLPAEAPPHIEPPPAREPFWDYVDLIWLIGILVAAVVILGLFGAGAFAISPRLKDDPGILLLSLQFALYGAIYLGFAFVFNVRHGKPVMKSLGWRASTFNLGLAVLIGPLLAFAIAGIAALLHTPKVPSPIEEFTKNPISLGLVALMAITIAPLFEELVFRGFLQPLLCRSFGVIAGIAVTSLIFGSLHGFEYQWAWQYVFAVSLVGVAFGFVRARTNSIIPSTIMHGCYNAVFVVALVASKYGKA
ncbi:MAG: CPBP family intramembrane metalloprotease [Acidobacteriaceae bacterium]|nr:CPBP family intramembrane metalloprotease [Acidobacteriaceae bacterium]